MTEPLAFQSYESKSEPFSAQRLVNLYWETAPVGGKSPGILFKRPGLVAFSTVGTGPIRGIETLNNIPIVISENEAYSVDSSGVATLLTGAIPGVEIVDMANNGTQIAVVANKLGFIIEGTTVTQITDVNFPSAVSSVTYQDGFFIWSEADSQRWILSPLLDGLGPYDPLDFASAEQAPDNLVKVFADHSDLFLIGEGTIEPWYNAGTSPFPYAENAGTLMELGCASRDTIQKLGSAFVWLGAPAGRGGLSVWMAKGYTAQRISTHALEAKWVELGAAGTYAFTFRLEGHSLYVLTFPDKGTFVYNKSTGLWCEWATYLRDDWTPLGFSPAYGRRLVGDRQSNMIYDLDANAFEDDLSVPIVWIATSPPIATPDGNYAAHGLFRVDMEVGVGLSSGQGSNPICFLQWADEDGVSFNNLKPMRMGRIGQRKLRVYRRALGRSRSRTYRITGSEPVKTAIYGAYYEIDPGTG